MRKGQTKRVWTPEQKSEIVHKHLDDHISVRTLEREYTADRSMICRWVKEYIAEGESAFIPKGHPGNPFLVSVAQPPTRTTETGRNTYK